jgi:hypothetical protein
VVKEHVQAAGTALEVFVTTITVFLLLLSVKVVLFLNLQHPLLVQAHVVERVKEAQPDL